MALKVALHLYAKYISLRPVILGRNVTMTIFYEIRHLKLLLLVQDNKSNFKHLILFIMDFTPLTISA